MMALLLEYLYILCSCHSERKRWRSHVDESKLRTFPLATIREATCAHIKSFQTTHRDQDNNNSNKNLSEKNSINYQMCTHTYIRLKRVYNIKPCIGIHADVWFKKRISKCCHSVFAPIVCMGLCVCGGVHNTQQEGNGTNTQTAKTTIRFR